MLSRTLRQFFVKHKIDPSRILVAASGGVDSTALLVGMAGLRDEGFEVICAHVNHQLRGADSAADELYVADLCNALAIPLKIADGSLDADRVRALGVEAAAREVRYARLHELREATGARWIATAHQQDDQAETVLLRLVTGCGLAGLRGIHAVRDDGVLRPLLDLRRAEIESWLARRGYTPRFDESNADPRFLRNRLREILRRIGGTEALVRVAETAEAQWEVAEAMVDLEESRLVVATETEARFIDRADDPSIDRALLLRQIRRLDPSTREISAADLERLTRHHSRRVTVTPKVELLCEGDLRILRLRPSPPLAFVLPLSAASKVTIPGTGLTIHLRRHDTCPADPRVLARSGRQLFQIPDGVEESFLVRSRRAGDRFRPLGAPGAKKLKDILIDRKIDADERDRLPVLVCAGEIVWVAGVTVSELHKVSSPGSTCYEVWLEGEGAADITNLSRLHR
jgi:tRNA(Ile)-lysidine synthase